MPAASIVEMLKRGQVAILGDAMLDRYVRGDVTRVSAEAPVPVLCVVDESHIPGGAANVAANVATLGGSAILIGVAGEDKAGQQLIDALQDDPRLSCRLVRIPDRPTTIKTRFVGGNHQILRVDREDRRSLEPHAESSIIAELQTALLRADVLVISDYAKGVLSDRVLAAAFGMARSAGIPVLVDPKRRDLSQYRGATIITPNRSELSACTGLACETDVEAERAASIAINASDASILLTRSERGMSYFQKGKPAAHSPAAVRRVFDVAGAGDTVVAAFALGLAAGIDVIDSMRIANAAAGVAVSKYGTSVVSWAELEIAMLDGRALDDGNVVIADRAVALARCTQWKNAGLKIGFTNGCFDLVHPGHIRLIRAAAAACDRLVVGLNDDESVRRLKGRERPYQTQQARVQVIAGIRDVSLVTLFEEDTPIELIKALRPDVIVKGGDYTEDAVVGGDFVKSYGGSVLLVDLEQGYSTTAIAEKARRGLT